MLGKGATFPEEVPEKGESWPLRGPESTQNVPELDINGPEMRIEVSMEGDCPVCGVEVEVDVVSSAVVATWKCGRIAVDGICAIPARRPR
ncbi:hypothetical protein LCGC14_1291130 [marine sediment metagenome]|uniref:Uncharacterized protein n=1 Tax=marine sediment metagenome TaxID=412755 RepID=A0A0F9KU12_9ZZZZ